MSYTMPRVKTLPLKMYEVGMVIEFLCDRKHMYKYNLKKPIDINRWLGTHTAVQG